MADNILLNPMLAQAQKEEKPISQAASQMGKARAASLSPERRQEIARAAAQARWAEKKDEEPEQSPPKKVKKRKKH